MNRRIALILLCILLAVLSITLGIRAYSRHLLGKLNYVDPETASTLSQEQLDAYLETEETEPAVPTMEAGDVEFDSHETQISGNNTINILLIGQDRREGEKRARSDTMILCTFNKLRKTLTMTSFLRDLYVQIPGYQNNRINAAYTAGGMKLLNQTLERNFGVTVDGNIEVDFTQFSRIVDLLDGVTMELRQDEAEAINKAFPGNLTAGVQLLNGEQALAYARIRKLDADGDFSRTDRQRKLLTALLSTYQNSNLTTILSLLDEILPMITTDLTQTEILAYAKELFPILPELEIHSQYIPEEGTYSYKTIRNMAVLVADMDAARALLEQTLLEEEN